MPFAVDIGAVNSVAHDMHVEITMRYMVRSILKVMARFMVRFMVGLIPVFKVADVMYFISWFVRR